MTEVFTPVGSLSRMREFAYDGLKCREVAKNPLFTGAQSTWTLETRVQDGETLTLSSSFDESGSLKSLTYPSGRQIAYAAM